MASSIATRRRGVDRRPRGTLVVTGEAARPWHLQLRPRTVQGTLVLAVLLSLAAASGLSTIAGVAPVWFAGAVLVGAYWNGPAAVLPVTLLSAAVVAWNQAGALGLPLVHRFGLLAAAYLAVGMAAAGLFSRLFRRLTDEHRLRLEEVEAERNRAVELAVEREHLQAQLTHSATHDGLTGLANRSLLLSCLEQTLAARRAGGGACAVLFLDLDDFKSVNDTLGHGAGDHLLEIVGERLRHGVRGSDLVARLGGDEFAILFPDFDAEAADTVVGRVLAALTAPIQLGTRSVTVKASAGLVVSDGDDTALGLLGKADLAMYSVKEGGKAALAVFETTMQSTRAERAELERDLRTAVSNGEFRVVYQPLVDLRSGLVVGCEALTRWVHPTRGMVSPDQFIPLAEATGDIVGIGEWVLEQACRRLSGWSRRAGVAEQLMMAVNVSARQLADPDVVSRFADVLRRSAVDPRQVNLEITESLLLDDDEEALRVLWQLRALGFRLAVDDFGTGYSSLSRLGRLPIDKLKIDKSFVLGLAATPDGRAHATLVSAATAMAHGLQLQVVAEGVETAEQLALLRHVGVDIGQGYLFGRPAAPEEIDVTAAPFPLPAPDGAWLARPDERTASVKLMPSAQPTTRRPERLSTRLGIGVPAQRRDGVPVTAAAVVTPDPATTTPAGYGRRRTDLPVPPG